MILLTHHSSILLGVAPEDFRRGIDGLVAQCRNTLEQEPSDGTIFIFINRAKTMIRALSYDGTGYWLMTKRLSRGKFIGWPTGDQPLSSASARQLRLLINEGELLPVDQPAPNDSHAASLAFSPPSTTLNSLSETSTALHRPVS